MAKKVTSKQITYAAAAIILTTSLLTKQLYIYTKTEAWIAVVGGAIVSLLVMLLYAALAKRFPGLSLIEINEAVFGVVIGKVVSALYIFFFVTIASLNVNIAGSFVKGFILPNTPVIFILSLLVIVCAWAVRKGPENLMKYNVLIVAVCIVVILFNTVLLYRNIQVKNLLPFFNLNPVNYAVGVHTITMIPLCDPIVLMMFLPFIQNTAEFGKAVSKGVMLGVVILLLIVVRDITVLGIGIEFLNYPQLMSIRQIDVGDILTRLDIVYISILIILMFYKVSIFYYAAVSGIQRFLKFDSYRFLVNIIGILLILYAITVFRSASEHFEWLVSGAAPFHNTFFVVLLPVLTMIVSVIRGFIKVKSAASDDIEYMGGE